ncbi:MAG TPA: 3-isopropylmalate dehydratase [Thermoplasmata archaeon]|nr:3-isopropylmalate dehydratase [Thermoplasmata archaeon]HUJ77643.1 3-isopropylmalate dehydratase [Thermoplasmata archaeon]
MEKLLVGRVWTLGKDVDTDQIIGGKYLTVIDPNELKKHVFEIALPEFAAQARAGDIVIADENFGSGSSREHAPQALRAIGVAAIVADSFARIFFRNAINLGLPAIEARGVRAIFETGDTARLDLEGGTVTNDRTGASVRFPPLPPHLLDLLEAGGLVEKVRRELAASPPAPGPRP